MNSEYIITQSGVFVNANELYHWGIKGMKWGVRRYQNSDGSLTAAGRKRYTNSDGTLNEKGKKKFGDSVKTTDDGKSTSSSTSSTIPKQKQALDMDDKELQDRVNRLRNEDAYRDLSKKLGYDSPKTELDIKIAEMEKQKKYLELQRDIKNLTPKKVSKGQQIVDSLMKKVIEPAATEAGKKLLTQYLTEAGAQALGKTAKKEASKIEKTVNDSAERVKAKEEKKAAKQQAKEKSKAEKQSEKQHSKDKSDTETVKAKIVKDRNTSNKESNAKTNSFLGDMHLNEDGVYEYGSSTVTSLATTRNTSSGRSTVSKYLNSPISGLLPSSKDDDD